MMLVNKSRSTSHILTFIAQYINFVLQKISCHLFVNLINFVGTFKFLLIYFFRDYLSLGIT